MTLKRFMNIANAKELFAKDRVGLLRELVKASLIKFPFQCLSSFGAFLPYERATPSFRDLLAAMMRGEGGLCGHLNTHMMLQLESLGYETELIGGVFRRTGIPLSHYMMKVKIPAHVNKPETPMGKKEGKTFLVDVGCGIPIHEPICLDTLPYKGRAGGLNYRYEWVDSHTLQRVNECGDALLGEKPSDFVSPQDYVIDTRPKKFTDFLTPVHAVYSNPRSVFLHQGMYCFRYLDITEDDFEIVCVRGTDLMFITKETRHAQSFGSYEEIKPSLLKYFPMINPEDIRLAVKHYSIPFEEALKMSSKPKQSDT